MLPEVSTVGEGRETEINNEREGVERHRLTMRERGRETETEITNEIKRVDKNKINTMRVRGKKKRNNTVQSKAYLTARCGGGECEG